MQALKMIGLLLLAGVLGIVALAIYNVAPNAGPVSLPTITSFEECVAAGNAVMESYPRQCRSQDGQLFVEEIEETWYSEEIEGISANSCAVAGCSQQLCVSAAEAPTIVTDCAYREEYICYAEAACEPQANGECGWTQTPELQRCLANPPSSGFETELEGELQVM